MASRFKGAIFDMDGTILDSMGCWRSLNVKFLKKRGLPVPEEIRGRELITHSAAAARLYLEKYDLGMTFDEIIEEMEADMRSLYRDVIKPKPGAPEAIRALKAAGLKLCVATLTPRSVAESALRRNGLLDAFDFVLSAKDTPLKKSDPEFFRAVAGRMNLVPEACAVFEDAVYAMRGARAAGCAVVAVGDAASAPDIEEIREISDIYMDDYILFTPEALLHLDSAASRAV
jgi:HAD superfamily hydrolase (TIGR01509 family)